MLGVIGERICDINGDVFDLIVRNYSYKTPAYFQNRLLAEASLPAIVRQENSSRVKQEYYYFLLRGCSEHSELMAYVG